MLNYFVKNFECEVCKERMPKVVMVNGELFEVFWVDKEFSKMPFMVVELQIKNHLALFVMFCD